MNTLLIIIAVAAAASAAIAGYFVLGWRVYAMPTITRKIQERSEEWPSLAHKDLGRWRKSETEDALFALTLWPIALLHQRLVNQGMASAPLAPAELQQQVRQRDERIAELERELKIR